MAGLGLCLGFSKEVGRLELGFDLRFAFAFGVLVRVRARVRVRSGVRGSRFGYVFRIQYGGRSP